jgi:hypothetical protein
MILRTIQRDRRDTTPDSKRLTLCGEKNLKTVIIIGSLMRTA